MHKNLCPAPTLHPQGTPNPSLCPEQEARFDRHFVRDLTWSRFQLEQLAERRFIAAQRPTGSQAGTLEASSTGPGKGPTAFSSLFEKVNRLLCGGPVVWHCPFKCRAWLFIEVMLVGVVDGCAGI